MHHNITAPVGLRRGGHREEAELQPHGARDARLAAPQLRRTPVAGAPARGLAQHAPLLPRSSLCCTAVRSPLRGSPHQTYVMPSVPEPGRAEPDVLALLTCLPEVQPSTRPCRLATPFNALLWPFLCDNPCFKIAYCLVYLSLGGRMF